MVLALLNLEVYSNLVESWRRRLFHVVCSGGVECLVMVVSGSSGWWSQV